MSERVSYPVAGEYLEPFAVRAVRPRRYRLNIFLFLMTVLTTLFWGAYLSANFESQGSAVEPLEFFQQVMSHPALLYKGAAYCFAIMIILLAHEMGHYIACCYYKIHATLPFFLPAPIAWTGTFGAFIRIRSPFPDRKSLFDVGIAGPIAGFVFAIPFIYLGLHWSTLVPKTADQIYLFDPLIFRLVAQNPPTHDYLLHPVGFAAWFACLATSLNLLPIAQLDGGHISYALFRKRAYTITWIFFSALLVLGLYGFTQSFVAGVQWIFYCVLLLVLRKIAGFRHPPTMNDEAPIGTARVIWGVIALIVFVLTFMPVTIFT
ncbi:MAG TPA: site-2 protease family protein [Acidobacteriota bacterium]|nr:site-2 protease family protein [Acidobacteriota bacterium]